MVALLIRIKKAPKKAIYTHTAKSIRIVQTERWMNNDEHIHGTYYSFSWLKRRRQKQLLMAINNCNCQATNCSRFIYKSKSVPTLLKTADKYVYRCIYMKNMNLESIQHKARLTNLMATCSLLYKFLPVPIHTHTV